jgi:energy-coupling factor transporter ATP-binding protein EcfA2
VLLARDVWAQPPGAVEPAVRGVSFELARGEWVAVTGANGSGKSTLALAAAGLWPLLRGTVEVQGAPLIANAAGRAHAGIATVLQEPASQLFEHTVRDEVAFAARNLGATGAALREAVDEWATRLGLDGLMERDPHRLSAGWQQRVLLAGALASSPRLLVADEAAAHLDAAARARVLEVIRAEVARGLAVLWVTQDGGESAAADRLLTLEPGGRLATAVIAGPARPHVGGRAIAMRPGVGVVGERLSVRIEPGTGLDGPRVRIAAPVQFVMAAGHPVALVGPNASGKTVALEAIAGVARCPQVSVRVEPAGGRPPILASQYPELQVFGDTVAEEVRFGADQRGGSPGTALEVAAQLIVELGLDRSVLGRSPWALSSGERRLVQLVAALVTPASAILVDEPTCGLDPGRARLLGELLARVARDIPTAVATQDAALVGRLGAEEWRLGG